MVYEIDFGWFLPRCLHRLWLWSVLYVPWQSGRFGGPYTLRRVCTTRLRVGGFGWTGNTRMGACTLRQRLRPLARASAQFTCEQACLRACRRVFRNVMRCWPNSMRETAAVMRSGYW